MFVFQTKRFFSDMIFFHVQHDNSKYFQHFWRFFLIKKISSKVFRDVLNFILIKIL